MVLADVSVKPCSPKESVAPDFLSYPDLPGRIRNICFQKGTGTICEEIMQEEKYRRKAYQGKRE